MEEPQRTQTYLAGLLGIASDANSYLSLPGIPAQPVGISLLLDAGADPNERLHLHHNDQGFPYSRKSWHFALSIMLEQSVGMIRCR
jgi:hypothetical protein